jgi:hypothetical protein
LRNSHQSPAPTETRISTMIRPTQQGAEPEGALPTMSSVLIAETVC